MKQLAFSIVLIMIIIVCLCACEEKESTPDMGKPSPITGETRSFALGFTDFPYARTSDAYLEGYEIIEKDADMVVMHFDDGIPWQAAFEKSDYGTEIENDLEGKVSLIPEDHIIYLAITPISFERDDIAKNKSDEATPWRPRLDDPDVITAYINHANTMIEMFSPDYFAYAIEVNLFYHKTPDRWEEFMRLAAATYTSIKADHPSLPVFITIQADFFHPEPDKQTAALHEILPYTDYIAISTYPFTNQIDQTQLPSNHFSAITNLAPTKPFAISETAWPAEDITDPYPITVQGSEESQSAYLEWLIDEANRLGAVFVTWFFTRDYDQFWEAELQNSPIAPIIRIWKDTGLYDGEGNPRPALDIWREALDLTREGE